MEDQVEWVLGLWFVSVGLFTLAFWVLSKDYKELKRELKVQKDTFVFEKLLISEANKCTNIRCGSVERKVKDICENFDPSQLELQGRRITQLLDYLKLEVVSVEATSKIRKKRSES